MIEFSLPLWSIPAAFTAVFWIVAAIYPKKDPRDYGFGPLVIGILASLFALIATLTVWLIFFVIV